MPTQQTPAEIALLDALTPNIDPEIFARDVADTGRSIESQFGKPATAAALLSAWQGLAGVRRPPTPGDANIVWQAEKTAQLRSLSWLIQFQGEWL